MPREAKREKLSESLENGIAMVTYRCPFMDNEVEKTIDVTVPANAGVWQSFVARLTGDPLETQYSRWLGAVIVAAKAAEREAAVAESTFVKRDGKDIDVLSMRSDKGMEDPQNVKLACAVINAAFMESNAFGWNGIIKGKGTSAPQNAYIAARRKLVEAKRVQYKGEGEEHQRMVLPV